MRQTEAVGREFAETLALRALGWIVGSEEMLPAFLGATGLSAADLGSRTAEPELLVSVLDFLLLDDARVIAFCDAAGYGYGEPLAARRALPGGEEPHWT